MKWTKYANGSMAKTDSGTYRVAYYESAQRKFSTFKTKGEAERFLEGKRDDKRVLTPEELDDALQAMKIVDKNGGGKTLVELVLLALSLGKDIKRAKVEDASRTYLSMSAGHVGELHAKQRRLIHAKIVKAWGDRYVDEIGAEDVSTFVAGMNIAPVTMNDYVAKIRVFLRWCKKMGYVKQVATDGVEPYREVFKGTNIIRPSELINLFAACIGWYVELLPYFIFSAFCGVRTAEVMKMKWDDYDWIDGSIVLDGATAKGRGNAFRRIQLMPVALDWIKSWKETMEAKYAEDAAELRFWTTGKIIKHDYQSYTRYKINKIYDIAGVKHTNNCLRHSFCTYGTAMMGYSEKIAEMAGHSVAIHKKHYDGRARKIDGDMWFAVTPESVSKGAADLIVEASKIPFDGRKRS